MTLNQQAAAEFDQRSRPVQIRINNEDTGLSRCDVFAITSVGIEDTGVRLTGSCLAIPSMKEIRQLDLLLPFDHVVRQRSPGGIPTLWVRDDRQLILSAPAESKLAAHTDGIPKRPMVLLEAHLASVRGYRQLEAEVQTYLLTPYTQIGAAMLFLIFAGLMRLAAKKEAKRR